VSEVHVSKDGRTEKATPQRRKKAREDGQVARSQEVAIATSFVALVATCAVFGRSIVDAAMTAMRAAFLGAGSPEALGASGGSALQLAVVMAGPFLVITTFAALASSVAQVGFRLNAKLAKPKLSHLNPKKGMEKLKPKTAGWELARSTAKLAAVAVVVWPMIAQWREHLGTDRTLAGGIDRLSGVYGTIVVRAAVLALVIAAADVIFQRRKFEKQIRMSKHDIKREYKDSEGDPLVKAARRRRQSELSRNRMLRDAASADVLLVNPTHLAVALRYDPIDGAPRVIAKGADKVADKLRAIAGRNGIPITADKPLARTLFRTCKVGQHVPASLYEAVAVVLAVAYRRSGRGPASRPLEGTAAGRRRTLVRAAA
jgi:flagellar biosynthesis protein FlhB